MAALPEEEKMAPLPEEEEYDEYEYEGERLKKLAIKVDDNAPSEIENEAREEIGKVQKELSKELGIYHARERRWGGFIVGLMRGVGTLVRAAPRIAAVAGRGMATGAKNVVTKVGTIAGRAGTAGGRTATTGAAVGRTAAATGTGARTAATGGAAVGRTAAASAAAGKAAAATSAAAGKVAAATSAAVGKTVAAAGRTVASGAKVVATGAKVTATGVKKATTLVLRPGASSVRQSGSAFSRYSTGASRGAVLRANMSRGLAASRARSEIIAATRRRATTMSMSRRRFGLGSRFPTRHTNQLAITHQGSTAMTTLGNRSLATLGSRSVVAAGAGPSASRGAFSVGAAIAKGARATKNAVMGSSRTTKMIVAGDVAGIAFGIAGDSLTNDDYAEEEMEAETNALPDNGEMEVGTNALPSGEKMEVETNALPSDGNVNGEREPTPIAPLNVGVEANFTSTNLDLELESQSMSMSIEYDATRHVEKALWAFKGRYDGNSFQYLLPQPLTPRTDGRTWGVALQSLYCSFPYRPDHDDNIDDTLFLYLKQAETAFNYGGCIAVCSVPSKNDFTGKLSAGHTYRPKEMSYHTLQATNVHELEFRLKKSSRDLLWEGTDLYDVGQRKNCSVIITLAVKVIDTAKSIPIVAGNFEIYQRTHIENSASHFKISVAVPDQIQTSPEACALGISSITLPTRFMPISEPNDFQVGANVWVKASKNAKLKMLDAVIFTEAEVQNWHSGQAIVESLEKKFAAAASANNLHLTPSKSHAHTYTLSTHNAYEVVIEWAAKLARLLGCENDEVNAADTFTAAGRHARMTKNVQAASATSPPDHTIVTRVLASDGAVAKAINLEVSFPSQAMIVCRQLSTTAAANGAGTAQILATFPIKFGHCINQHNYPSHFTHNFSTVTFHKTNGLSLEELEFIICDMEGDELRFHSDKIVETVLQLEMRTNVE